MTYDNDKVHMKLPGYRGTLNNTCRALGLPWPPPEFIRIAGGPFTTPVYRRTSMSDVPDSDAVRGVQRVAEYEFDHDEPTQRVCGRNGIERHG